MAKPKISDEAIKRILELKETHTQHEIARVVGTTKTTVNKIIKAKMINRPKVVKNVFAWEDFDNSIL